MNTKKNKELPIKKELNISIAVEETTDRLGECIKLLGFIDTMKPEEKWKYPLLKSAIFKDFRVQLLTIIEDYGDERNGDQ